VGIELNPGPGPKKSKIVLAVKTKNLPSKLTQKVRGKGGYFLDTLKSIIPKGTAAAAGGALGGLFGDTGRKIGGFAGDLFSKITGLGNYKVHGNSLMTNNQSPSFGNEGQGISIVHKEFIADVTGSTAFTLNNYMINPGNAALWPWLAILAQSFEEYELLGMLVHYKTTSGNAVSSNDAALGTVVLATNYNVADPNFTTKQQMESYEYATSCSPAESMLHPIECSPKQNFAGTIRFVLDQGTAVPTGYDPRLYNFANLQVATSGQQTAYVVGELWVTYHIRLMKPRIPIPIGATNICAHITESAITTATAAAPYGTTGAKYNFANLTISQPTATPKALNLYFTQADVGKQFLLAYVWNTANSNIAANPTLTLGTNYTAQAILQDSANSSNAIYSQGASYAMIIAVFTVTNYAIGTAAQEILVGGLTSMTAGTFDGFICQIDSGLTGQELKQRLVARKGGLCGFDDLLDRVRALESKNLLRTSECDSKECWTDVPRLALRDNSFAFTSTNGNISSTQRS